MTVWTYAYQGQDSHRIKIGRTTKGPEGRFKGERPTFCPEPLVFLGSVESHASLEGKLKRDLDDWKIVGEWFYPSIEVFSRLYSAGIIKEPEAPLPNFVDLYSGFNGWLAGILQEDSEYPLAFVEDRDEFQVMVRCPLCGGLHRHGSSMYGLPLCHKIAHCYHRTEPNGYYVLDPNSISFRDVYDYLKANATEKENIPARAYTASP